MSGAPSDDVAAGLTGRPDLDGHGDREERDEFARKLFVYASAVVLIGFVLVQVIVGQGGVDVGAAQAKRLMPQIRAEVVDLPLTAAQLEWPLEMGDGRTTTLAALPRDRVVFLNFWATWCAPCRDELPSLFRLRQAMVGRPFSMVAVSYDEQWSDIRDFFTKWVGRLPSDQQMMLLRDTRLDEGGTLRESFGTTQIPDSYVIKDGRVIARFVNARQWTDPAIVSYFEKLAPLPEAE